MSKDITVKNIILASASPRRRELLDQIGITYTVMPSDAEEKAKSSMPEDMVQELSGLKARDIMGKLSEEERKKTLVIGADTVVSLDGRIMGKPGNEEEAVRMLTALQGRTHQVYTGVTLLWQQEETGELYEHSFHEKTEVTMFPMSAEEICDYVATGEPMDKAGAYGIQGKCAAFIKGISGDYNNVVGLPIGRLYQEIKENYCANSTKNKEENIHIL